MFLPSSLSGNQYFSDKMFRYVSSLPLPRKGVKPACIKHTCPIRSQSIQKRTQPAMVVSPFCFLFFPFPKQHTYDTERNALSFAHERERTAGKTNAPKRNSYIKIPMLQISHLNEYGTRKDRRTPESLRCVINRHRTQPSVRTEGVKKDRKKKETVQKRRERTHPTSGFGTSFEHQMCPTKKPERVISFAYQEMSERMSLTNRFVSHALSIV
mmetsp:Transcript_33988/g.87280  ORF Transcript_33988/g.87280 Transcript_33988/m.87280 type:complete len:212 (+) Transcript_33988:536-1171(+)